MPRYYKQIKGKKYDRKLLEAAEAISQKEPSTKIGLKGVKKLIEEAQDGGKVTAVEERTLAYIWENFKLTKEATKWLNQMEEGEEISSNESEFQPMLEAMGLTTLQLFIDKEEISRQFKLQDQQSFESVLKAGIEALLVNNESGTSLRDIIVAEEQVPALEVNRMNEALIQYLNEGQLYLVPLNFPARTCQGVFLFKLPEKQWPIHQYWQFGFVTPNKTDYHFLALVRRQDYSQAFSFGYIPQTISIENAIEKIKEHTFKLKGLSINLDKYEAKKQELLPGQFFFHQALENCVRSFFRDDITPGSLIRKIQRSYPELKRNNFGWIGEYWNAIDRNLQPILNGGELTLLTDKDKIEKDWVFQLSLPVFPKLKFCAIQKRDGSRAAYNYAEPNK